MNKKRILYISNHKTLSRFEIPMLLDMGYEVFMPKKTDFDISATINYEYDTYLTIPQEDLEALNNVDFYYTPINEDISNLINKYFDIAFTVQYPVPFRSLVDHFKGVIVLRGYGMPDSYTGIITLFQGFAFNKKLEALGDRFWFGYGYETMPEIEGRLLRGRSIFMPLGLSNAKVDDRWIGNGRNILYPCPKIKTEKLFENNYRKFKEDFKGLPYKITGVQPIYVENDKDVLGYLSDDQYEMIFKTSSCMLYTSQFKTHIHYTPAEAITWGLPLLFMAEGLLDYLGGKDLPGRCKTIKEARRKAIKLLNNNRKFADEIREGQPILLEKFTESYCRDKWNIAMSKIDSSASKISKLKSEKRKKLAIILPNESIKDSVDFSVNITKAIVNAIKSYNDNIDVIFSFVDSNKYVNNTILNELKDIGVSVRSFKWDLINKSQIMNLVKLKDWTNPTHHIIDMYEKFCVPSDQISHFNDCDFLLFTSDKIENPPFINIPYGVVVDNFIQRIRPKMAENTYENNCKLQFVRNSEFCLVNTNVAEERLIQYAGVRKENIILIPFIYSRNMDYGTLNRLIKMPKKYFIWRTDFEYVEDHAKILSELSEYYISGGSVKCCIVGKNSKSLDPKTEEVHVVNNDYIKEIRKIICDNIFIEENLLFLDELNESWLLSVLRDAQFLLNTKQARWENTDFIKAAYLNIPTISYYYKDIININNSLMLGMNFFNQYKENSLKNLLFELEYNIVKIKQQLPSNEKLNDNSINNIKIYNQIYNQIKFKFNL